MSFEKLALQRIQEAMDRGEFDNLSNKGQPLKLDEYFAAPEDYRMGHSVLKNANVLPAEVELLSEVGRLNERIAECSDEVEMQTLKQQRDEKQLNLRLILERNKKR